MSTTDTRAPLEPDSRDALSQKMMRYCGVSVINLVVGQSLLFMFHAVIGWGAVVSNLLAVFGSAVPAYQLSRKWVWRQNGAHSMLNEVLPFWGLAVTGLILSTLAVGYAERNFEADIMVNVASVVLERVMWRTAR